MKTQRATARMPKEMPIMAGLLASSMFAMNDDDSNPTPGPDHFSF